MSKNQILKEFNELQNSTDPNDLFAVDYWDDDSDNPNIMEWKITLLGPKGTFYEGGFFLLKVNFSDLYPTYRPEIRFRTKIYHVNVDEKSGDICISSLNNWLKLPSHKKNMRYILDSLAVLLFSQNPDDPLEFGKADLFKEDINQFKKNCQNYVKTYATPENYTNFSIQGFTE